MEFAKNEIIDLYAILISRNGAANPLQYSRRKDRRNMFRRPTSFTDLRGAGARRAGYAAPLTATRLRLAALLACHGPHETRLPAAPGRRAGRVRRLAGPRGHY